MYDIMTPVFVFLLETFFWPLGALFYLAWSEKSGKLRPIFLLVLPVGLWAGFVISRSILMGYDPTPRALIGYAAGWAVYALLVRKVRGAYVMFPYVSP